MMCDALYPAGSRNLYHPRAIAAPVRRPSLRKTWQNAEGLPLMVEISAGEFVMGENPGDKFANDTERPSHRVTISANFALGKFPVTVSEFRRFCDKPAEEEDDAQPVVRVNWRDATAYCRWLTERTGREYRLPSEAEWEYACRLCGTAEPFSFGDEISTSDANFLYDEHGRRIGLGHRTSVEKFAPNAFGLHDMHGNVCEWVMDSWHADYLGTPNDGAAWVAPDDPAASFAGARGTICPACCAVPGATGAMPIIAQTTSVSASPPAT